MNFKVQRFQQGHPLYTLASLMHEGKFYQSVFGQCVAEDGTFLHYTLERLDTLILEGVYNYDLYFSPHNKTTVPRLTMFEGVNISARELESHIANWAYELDGCTAHGKSIILSTCTLAGSGIAFHELMNMIAGQTGTITYEKFIN
jgi:hypothetical protein